MIFKDSLMDFLKNQLRKNVLFSFNLNFDNFISILFILTEIESNFFLSIYSIWICQFENLKFILKTSNM